MNRMKKVLCAFLLLAGGMEATPYLNPGLIGFKDGNWIGTDHLYNIGNSFHVEVEVVQPEPASFSLSEALIKKEIVSLLETKGIQVTREITEASPPLPLFHFLFFALPVGDKIVLSCEGRVIEQVKLGRVVLPEGTYFQGVTWESSALLQTSPAKVEANANRLARKIASNFLDKYEYYRSLKR